MDNILDFKPHLDVTDVSDWDRQRWLAYRNTGIGCSEIGTILGMNKYEDAATVFSKKVGVINIGTVDNEAMFMGRVLEPVIQDLWEYYDPNLDTWEATCANMEARQKVREVIKPHVYVRNPKYPWLFGGPDGLFKHNNDLGVLEIKTISKFTSDQYEDGIPTSYIFQIHGYMMLFDIDYAEIAMLQDGRVLQVFPFDRNERICEMIDKTCTDFWDRVLKARKHELSGKDWQHLEPTPNDTAPYEEFLKLRFQEALEDYSVDATDSCQYWVDKYISFRDKENHCAKRKLLYANKIKNYMRDSDSIDGLEAARVTWRNTANGRRFSVRKK